MTSRTATAAALAAALIGGVYSVARVELRAQEQSVWDGIYTEEQAQRGSVIFDRECAQCHGPAGNGGSMAPALVGGAFSANYDTQTVGDLFERNKTTMPPGKENGLSSQQYADITAYILQVNKFPSGKTELSTQTPMLKGIKYLAQKP